MDHELEHSAKEGQQHNVTPPHQLRISDMLPQFLEYLKVEENRSRGTLARYESHIQRFRQAVGDCAVGAISSERLSFYKRHLLDAGLSPVTMAAMLSGLRSFLRYARNVRGLTVYDPEKVRRPEIPKQEVAYLTKEALGRFLRAIPLTPGARVGRVTEAVAYPAATYPGQSACDGPDGGDDWHRLRGG